MGPVRPSGPAQGLLGAPPVLLQGLALPGEHRDAGLGDGGGGVVLGGEDVARGPAHLGAQVDERLDQHRRLDGHVQRAGDAGAGQRLGVAVLLAEGHEAGHLDLGQVDLAAAEVGQADVGDLVRGGGGGGCGGWRLRWCQWRRAWATPSLGWRSRTAGRCARVPRAGRRGARQSNGSRQAGAVRPFPSGQPGCIQHRRRGLGRGTVGGAGPAGCRGPGVQGASRRGRFAGPDAGGVHASRRTGIVAPGVDENRPDGAAGRPGCAVGRRWCREAWTKTGPIRWLGDVRAWRPARDRAGRRGRDGPVRRPDVAAGGRRGSCGEGGTKDGRAGRWADAGPVARDVPAWRPAGIGPGGGDERRPGEAAGRPRFAAGGGRAARRGRKTARRGGRTSKLRGRPGSWREAWTKSGPDGVGWTSALSRPLGRVPPGVGASFRGRRRRVRPAGRPRSLCPMTGSGIGDGGADARRVTRRQPEAPDGRLVAWRRTRDTVPSCLPARLSQNAS